MSLRGIVIIAIVYHGVLIAQPSNTFHQEIKFSSHLIDNYQYDDAKVVLTGLHKSLFLRSTQDDTLNYYLGWIYYQQKILDTSSSYLKAVGKSSPYYYKSQFYHAFNTAYTGGYSKAQTLLDSLEVDTVENLLKLKHFEKASFYLLQRDYINFGLLADQFTGSYFPIANEEVSLKKYYENIKNFKTKSPWLAGGLSAIVPGMGKFYTGYKGEGTTAFLTVLSLAAISTESYLRAGPKSFQFISTSTLFSIFYIGNIWGSVHSVKKRNESFFKEIERKVKLDMHIPLGRVFSN